MNITDMHTNLNLEIDKSDTLDSVGFETEELDYWLNSAIRSFAITRYKGSSSARGEAFEQNQKRVDDLRTLVEEEVIIPSRGTDSSDKPNSYKASLPSSNTYWFTLSEEVLIAYQTATTAAGTSALATGSIYKVSGNVLHAGNPYVDGDYFIATAASYSGNPTGQVYLCSVKRQGITQTTADTYTFHIDNPYSEYHLENYLARPLRLFKQDEVELITDGDYGVVNYYIRYLFQPAEVVYNTVNCDLPVHTHDEIVKMAANMILENTENPRYRTHLNELLKTE
jgi:hypothetical protein